jgi:hypothetical protein
MKEAGISIKNYSEFIKAQYNLLCQGVKDIRIHDAALVAWSRAGGK